MQSDQARFKPTTGTSHVQHCIGIINNLMQKKNSLPSFILQLAL